MRAILVLALAVLTIFHVALFVRYWPHSLIIPEGVLLGPNSSPLVSGALGFAIATGLVTIWQLTRSKKLYLCAYIVGVGTLAVFVLRYLPIGRLVAPSPNLSGLIGACMTVALGWMCRPKAPQISNTTSGAPPRQISWIAFFVFTFNFFLALAPLSDMVPTGIQENGSWSPSSFQLGRKDSVGIYNNLIFVGIRSLISPIVENSILINALVSMILCACGVACLVRGIQILCGRIAALLALAFIITEGWVLTSAYAANLTVTLIANAGLLFYILTYILSGDTRSSSWRSGTFIATVFASCIVSLYSYAAVRIPWVLSIVVLGAVCLVRARGSLIAKTSTCFLHVVMPITVALTLVWGIGYRWDMQALQKDLLVSWPKESVISHPQSGELKDFVLIHNPDTPIWKQVARPANGDNLSLIWTRTPSETLRALGEHVRQIFREHPRTFLLSPLIFLLSVAAMFRLPLMDHAQKITIMAVSLWAVIWVSSFLSVPDPVAYRRGIAFSAIAPILAAFAFTPLCSARGLAIAIPTLLGVLCALFRLPDQLRFSNEPETRSRMFTVCGNSYAVRTLLKNGDALHVAGTPLFVASTGMENPREANCLMNAVRSNEWQRIFPGSSVVGAGLPTSIAGVMNTPQPNRILLYCSPNSMRESTVGAICNENLPSPRLLETIPVIYGGVSDKWVVFTHVKDDKGAISKKKL